MPEEGAKRTKRKRKKDEEEQKKYYARQQKQAEFEKWKNPPKANFVISKREPGEEGEEAEEGEGAGRKSKEQLEAEKRAILHQRIKPLDVEGAAAGRLVEKIKELHHQIQRLEGEKYDLEHRYKITQVQLTELADRARQANKIGDGLKRIQGATDDSVDRIQTRFAGAPSKVEMYSKYERQKDKRSYVDRHVLFTGPQWALPVERINPTKIVQWNEEGLPIYEEPGSEQHVAA
jgi:troponin T